MQNSQLITTLCALQPIEWRSFQKFLISPWFNQREDVIALALTLQKELAKPEQTQVLDKAKIWKKAFPNQAFHDKQMRYVMSFLLQAARDFMVMSALQSNTTVQDLLEFEAMQQRGLTSPLKNEQATEPDPALNRVLRRRRQAVSPPAPTILASETENFTVELLTETLREGCSFMEMRHASATQTDFAWLKTAIDFCREQQLNERFPTINMLLQTCLMLEKMASGEGDDHFYALQNILYQPDEIPVFLQRESWLRAINFAIRRQNQGDKSFGKHAFELYQLGITNGLILENGRISKKAYSNTLVLALLVGEWDWAENFLKTYRDFLPENERENTYRHNLATLFFKQKQFSKVLETLQNVAFTDSLHNLDDRRLLLCSYYELGEWASLHSLLDSFGIWLRRAKNLGYHRELYANLVKFTRRLADVRHQHQEVKNNLKKEILAAQNVAARDWLLEKL